MTPKLKICGITRLEDARFCAAAGVDFLGFIQYERSPRYVDPAAARGIIDWVYGPKPVGVFVDAPSDVVNKTADAAGFEFVQLHGDETVAACAEIERPVIKAIRVRDDCGSEELVRSLEAYREVADYILLDTYTATVHGGTGRSFDWNVARALALDRRVFLAGGLRESNLHDAVRIVRPFAVDVSSGVESEPGIKDFDKLGALFEQFDRMKAVLEENFDT